MRCKSTMPTLGPGILMLQKGILTGWDDFALFRADSRLGIQASYYGRNPVGTSRAMNINKLLRRTFGSGRRMQGRMTLLSGNGWYPAFKRVLVDPSYSKLPARGALHTWKGRSRT